MAASLPAIADAPVTVAGLGANSKVEIARRVGAGRIAWPGPVVMVFGRTLLCLVAQALVASVFWLQGHDSAWSAAAAWWTVWGTLVDLGCLAGMFWLARREGLRLRDLFGFDRKRLGRDVLLGVGLFLAVFPVTIIGGTMLASWLIFGTTQAPMYAGELTGRVLPWWGVLYSLTLWWLVWSPTEELTFNGYVLPRLEALTRRPWLAVAVVGLLWAAMHAAIPTLFDARYLAWRTLSFLPLCLTMSAVYLRVRRLVPLVITHWAMDFIGALFTLAW
jgi:membrane protease YdiL (CAAX protease family)